MTSNGLETCLKCAPTETQQTLEVVTESQVQQGNESGVQPEGNSGMRPDVIQVRAKMTAFVGMGRPRVLVLIQSTTTWGAE